MNLDEDDHTIICTNSQPTIQTKAKRCLSPVNETVGSKAFAAKRRKSIQINLDKSDNEDEDETEIIEFLDNRHAKRNSSRTERKSKDSKANDETLSRPKTTRKSNVRRSTRTKQHRTSYVQI